MSGQRARTSRRPTKCRACGSDAVLTITYGLLPEPPGLGEVIGGCIVRDDSPVWECGTCGARWGRLDGRSTQVTTRGLD